MGNRTKSIFLWILSFFLMIGVAVYQRLTGPTYPVEGQREIGKDAVTFYLPTSHVTDHDAVIKVYAPNKNIKGHFIYKRYKSYDTLKTVEMTRRQDTLFANIPKQPAAGKVIYEIKIIKENTVYDLTEEPVIIRFKGHVPIYILIPHIIFIFSAMVLSTRTGLEALTKGSYTFLYTKITLVLLFLGGLIFGPLVQKYAFDAFWTGWPVGHDLTDNKTIVSFIFWLTAFFKLRKNKENRTWPIIASVMLLIIFLIPHSLLGSEIDYRKTQNIE